MTGSYARGGEPQSVPDPDGLLHAEMVRRQRALNAAREAEEEKARAVKGALGSPHADDTGPSLNSTRLPPDPEHSLPDALTSGLVKALGSARRARRKWEEGHQVEATKDAALGLPDLYFDGALIKGMLKSGGAKFVGPHVWRTPPWKAPGARRWLGEKGFLNPNEPGHHWLIPLNGWGKAIPDFIKNQPWNIKGGLDAVTHGRIHGPYKVDGVKLAQFGVVRRFWDGTPAYAKAFVAGLIPRPDESHPPEAPPADKPQQPPR